MPGDARQERGSALRVRSRDGLLSGSGSQEPPCAASQGDRPDRGGEAALPGSMPGGRADAETRKAGAEGMVRFRQAAARRVSRHLVSLRAGAGADLQRRIPSTQSRSSVNMAMTARATRAGIIRGLWSGEKNWPGAEIGPISFD